MVRPLRDDAGENLVHPLGSVEDGERRALDALGRRGDQAGQHLDELVGGDQRLIAFGERVGPQVDGLRLGFGHRPLGVGVAVRLVFLGRGVRLGLDRLGLGSRLGQLALPVGLGLGLEVDGVARGFGDRPLPEGLRIGLGLDPVPVGVGRRPGAVSLRVRRTPHLGFELLLLQIGLPFGQHRLLGDDVLRRLGRSQRAGLGRRRVGLLGLGVEPGLLDGGVTFVLRLQGLRGLLLLGGRLVGMGAGDPGLAGHRRGERCGDVVDVPGRVLDLLNLERVDHDAQLLHFAVAAVLDLLGEAIALANDLLHGQAADDRTEVTGEDPPDQLLHVVLFGQEPSRHVGDGGGVVADLEGGDGPDVKPDPLGGDAVFGDLRFLQGK